jgi:hypothetical protein
MCCWLKFWLFLYSYTRDFHLFCSGDPQFPYLQGILFLNSYVYLYMYIYIYIYIEREREREREREGIEAPDHIYCGTGIFFYMIRLCMMLFCIEGRVVLVGAVPIFWMNADMPLCSFLIRIN